MLTHLEYNCWAVVGALFVFHTREEATSPQVLLIALLNVTQLAGCPAIVEAISQRTTATEDPEALIGACMRHLIMCLDANAASFITYRPKFNSQA